MIDTSKPLQLSDGTPVTFKGLNTDGDIIVDCPAGTSKRLGSSGSDTRRLFLPTGEHRYELRGKVTLQNVPETAPQFDPTKPVQTRSGKPARILATDLAGRMPLVAAVPAFYGSGEAVHRYYADGRASRYDEQPLDLVNVPVPTRHKFSVYFKAEDPEAEGLSFNRTGFGTISGRATIEMTVVNGLPTAVELVHAE